MASSAINEQLANCLERLNGLTGFLWGAASLPSGTEPSFSCYDLEIMAATIHEESEKALNLFQQLLNRAQHQANIDSFS